jgi:hypothetical protein
MIPEAAENDSEQSADSTAIASSSSSLASVTTSTARHIDGGYRNTLIARHEATFFMLEVAREVLLISLTCLEKSARVV